MGIAKTFVRTCSFSGLSGISSFIVDGGARTHEICGHLYEDVIVTGRPCGSVAQWSECSHGLREVLGSSRGRAVCFFLPCDIWWLSVGPCSGCEQQKDCLVGSCMVPGRFGDESN